MSFKYLDNSMKNLYNLNNFELNLGKNNLGVNTEDILYLK